MYVKEHTKVDRNYTFSDLKTNCHFWGLIYNVALSYKKTLKWHKYATLDQNCRNFTDLILIKFCICVCVMSMLKYSKFNQIHNGRFFFINNPKVSLNPIHGLIGYFPFSGMANTNVMKQHMLFISFSSTEH